jgi:hypothetical protein
LGPDAVEEGCNNIPQTIQRGASNAYFAKVVSSILIPPYSALVQQKLDRPDVWNEIEALPMIDGKLPETWLRTKAENLGVDPAAFIEAVYERIGTLRARAAAEIENISEESYRHDEFNAFIGPRPLKSERDDFDTEVLPASRYSGVFADLFERIVLVRKLRETRVLTGFSRIVPVEALTGPPASLSLEPKNWLPGFSVRGEGIFLELNGSVVRGWADQDEIKKRAFTLQSRSNKVARQRGLPVRIVSPQLVLVHTLSHLLIRQMAFECGYDSSNIRERLYVSAGEPKSMLGLLLYTASGDSEGTLGGLVRQGLSGRLESTLRAAMRNASICSSDPLCIESGGQGLFSMNLSACHACGLLPETSCEQGNLLLDRVAAIGTPERPTIGYFGNMLD